MAPSGMQRLLDAEKQTTLARIEACPVSHPLRLRCIRRPLCALCARPRRKGVRRQATVLANSRKLHRALADLDVQRDLTRHDTAQVNEEQTTSQTAAQDRRPLRQEMRLCAGSHHGEHRPESVRSVDDRVSCPETARAL